MKKLFALMALLFFVTAFKSSTETVSMKAFAEEAMKKSLIGSDPIIVMNQASAKIYSKTSINHYVFKDLNREDLIIIPKNADVIEEFWGEHGKKNGAIVHKAAREPKPNINALRFVLNGKEISRWEADTLNMKNVKSYICLKNKKTEQCVAFISTME